MDVPPFSVADKPLKMEEKEKLHFSFSPSENSWMNYSEVPCIDFSVKMIELANQKIGDRRVDNVVFDQTDAFDQGLVSHSFSAIIAFNIFHLLDDIPRTLARLNDLLPTGGLVNIANSVSR